VIFTTLSNDLWFTGQSIIALLLFINGIYLLVSARKAEIESQRQIFVGTSLFLLIAAMLEIGYLIDLYCRKYITNPYDPYPKYTTIGGPGYVYLMVVIMGLACIPLQFPLEKHLMQTKSLWRTKLGIITLVILLVPLFIYYIAYNLSLETTIGFIGLGFFVFLVINSIGGTLYFYIRLGAKSPGFVRKKAWNIGFGFLITFSSVALSFETKGDSIFENVIGPLLLIIGLWMLLRGELMKMNV
jgi:hypothetical protein